MISAYHKQRGMTIWGWAVVLALIAFFTMLTLAVLPMYLNHFKVMTHLQDVAKQFKADTAVRADIVDTLQKRFQVDNVDYADPVKNVKLEVDRSTRKTVVRLPYEVRAHFMSNMYIVGDFTDTHVELKNE